jgi:hypothetical protein
VSELRTTGIKQGVGHFSPAIFCMLGHQHHGLQSFQLVADHLASVGKGNLLLHRCKDPKELAHFIEDSAEARCRGHAPEPTHEVIALFDATVILLQSIVEVAVGPAEHIIAQGLADRTRGRKVSDEEMATLCIRPDPFHSEWNYTILSRTASIDNVIT